MVELKEMDLTKNEVTYKDFSKVNYSLFYDTFIAYWNNHIAGETISPFYMERFMKRGSTKNTKQLVDGKKAEGQQEVLIGAKMNPMIMKIIIVGVIVGAVALIAIIILNKMGILK